MQSVVLVIEFTFVTFLISAGIAYYTEEVQPTLSDLVVENLIPIVVVYAALVGLLAVLMGFGYLSVLLGSNAQIPLLVIAVSVVVAHLRPDLFR
jgi:hypothetical protein